MPSFERGMFGMMVVSVSSVSHTPAHEDPPSCAVLKLPCMYNSSALL